MTVNPSTGTMKVTMIKKELEKAKKRAKKTLRSVTLSELENYPQDFFDLIWESIETASTSFEKYFLTTLSTGFCNSQIEGVEYLGLAAELIMFSALTTDDLLDKTPYRNGHIPIYLKRGEGKAVISAFALIGIFEHCLQKGLSHNVTEDAKILIRERFWCAFRDIQAGQYMVDAYTQQSVASIQLLDKLAYLRCGTLIGSCFSVGAAFSGDIRKFDSFYTVGIWIGKALQHRNDILDFTFPDNQNIKPPFEDMINGQPNLVLAFVFMNFSKLDSVERNTIRELYGCKQVNGSYVLTEQDISILTDVLKKTDALSLAYLELKACLDNVRSELGSELNCEAGEMLLNLFEIIEDFEN
jgi:geranylgeranyl pyrophosphate synthase